ncbi:MAG TPA: NDP-sugar synthase, partial [Pyrinomonadaceae bacterium]|nr:NDP-sugar synthase [Pyrinomonadaceae bacterium]
PLTVYTPKPIVPVVNRPFLLYQIETLARSGVTDITLSLSYQPDKIEDILGDGSDYGVQLHFVTEPTPRGTGGAFKFAASGSNETTIVFNGDILTDVNLDKIIARHNEKRAAATITLTPVEDPSAYGLVQADASGAVQRFLEKPKLEDLADLNVNTINAGIYILEPEILDFIPEDESISFEYDVFPAILDQKLGFFAYVLDDDYWRDIGNPANYLAAHKDILAGGVKGFERPKPFAEEFATAAVIDKSSVIGDGCVIKPGASIRNSVLGPGVHVEEKVLIEDSVIWSHTRISSSAEIRGAIIARSCHIGRNTFISPGTVLGDKATLPDYSRT